MATSNRFPDCFRFGPEQPVAESITSWRVKSSLRWPISIRIGDVHIWHINLDSPHSRRRSWLRILDDGERSRVMSVHSLRRRSRFITAHVALRSILGGYLAKQPRDLRFEYGKFGRPHLVGTDVELEFNLSYAASRALVAVTRGRRIGVDIERIVESLPAQSLAKRFFSVPESQEVQRAGDSAATEVFTDCWVRKEAYLKATGLGLQGRLSTPDLSPSLGRNLTHLKLADRRSQQPNWSVFEIEVPPEFRAAAVVEGHDRLSIRSMCWTAGIW